MGLDFKKKRFWKKPVKGMGVDGIIILKWTGCWGGQLLGNLRTLQVVRYSKVRL
jgi:hypothetical protein